MYDLSFREQQVLAHLCEGQRDADIAADLYIGRETVKSHLKSIYRKLGVGSRTEAVALVMRQQQHRAEIDSITLAEEDERVGVSP